MHLFISLLEWVLRGAFPEEPVIRKRTVAVTLIVVGLAMAGLAAVLGVPIPVAVGLGVLAVGLGVAVGFLRRS